MQITFVTRKASSRKPGSTSIHSTDHPRVVDGIAQGRGGRWGIDAVGEAVAVWCSLPLDGAPA